jgi:hypothetical protein
MMMTMNDDDHQPQTPAEDRSHDTLHYHNKHIGYGEAPRLKISQTVTPNDQMSLFDVNRRSRIASTAAQRHATSRVTAKAERVGIPWTIVHTHIYRYAHADTQTQT